MKEYIEKSVVERMLWAVIMAKDERTIEEMLEDAPIVNAITIPDNATNGDMIKAMFPNIESRLDEKTGITLVKWADETTKTFKTSWWNALYKKEVEE